MFHKLHFRRISIEVPTISQLKRAQLLSIVYMGIVLWELKWCYLCEMVWKKTACLLLVLREPAHDDGIFSRGENSFSICVSEAHKWMADSLQCSPSSPARLTFTHNPTQKFIPKNVFKEIMMEKTRRISCHNVLFENPKLKC